MGQYRVSQGHCCRMTFEHQKSYVVIPRAKTRMSVLRSMATREAAEKTISLKNQSNVVALITSHPRDPNCPQLVPEIQERQMAHLQTKRNKTLFRYSIRHPT